MQTLHHIAMYKKRNCKIINISIEIAKNTVLLPKTDMFLEANAADLEETSYFVLEIYSEAPFALACQYQPQMEKVSVGVNTTKRLQTICPLFQTIILLCIYTLAENSQTCFVLGHGTSIDHIYPVYNTFISACFFRICIIDVTVNITVSYDYLLNKHGKVSKIKNRKEKCNIDRESWGYTWRVNKNDACNQSEFRTFSEELLFYNPSGPTTARYLATFAGSDLRIFVVSVSRIGNVEYANFVWYERVACLITTIDRKQDCEESSYNCLCVRPSSFLLARAQGIFLARVPMKLNLTIVIFAVIILIKTIWSKLGDINLLEGSSSWTASMSGTALLQMIHMQGLLH
ncbi:hypothetical protein EGR_10995 [Echinococcus granulosus]|uniref:Uncharacterized protein n=1 Tax=Echinococcus granulosus TaxID=6210 RepID=W6TZC1_ECHGR|nr:hypothetical protein EGR_10995 [Echinococcus granulosus]EUB54150.1 hypothetical protein EGR_10995 [Echinococcus granulosus]